MRANEQGVTLIEIILVLVIVGTFIILAFRQYQTFKLDQDVQQVRTNVRTLFQAMASYYKANCIQNKDYHTGNPVTAGNLDPSAKSLGTLVPIRIDQDLVPAYLPRWPVTDVPSIVNNSAGDGYVVQFNRAPIGSRTIDNVQVGRIYFWNIQVAIRLANPNLASTFQSLLAADCISTLQGNSVVPCSGAASGDYLVWSLSPSYATGESSTSWLTNPQLLQFKRQYIHDEMRALSDPNFASTQYYLCGG